MEDNHRAQIFGALFWLLIIGGIVWWLNRPSSKQPVTATSTTQAAFNPKQYVGRWLRDDPINTIGVPLRCRTTLTLASDGRFGEVTQIFHQNGQMVPNCHWTAKGTWQASENDKITFAISSRTPQTVDVIAIVSDDELDLLDIGENKYITVHGTFRRASAANLNAGDVESAQEAARDDYVPSDDREYEPMDPR